ncbi:MAG: hypothetical protein HZB23_01715 [Deltaproteobacteria bacterium]|nr:hypothetical protein [Deltaproteobacteria bacterium]
MDKKKIAAAVAGVMEYLKVEQAAIAQAGGQAQDAAPAFVMAPPMPPPSLYAISGRQMAMQWRNMFQMRAVRGLK